jgi:hypothetical protein
MSGMERKMKCVAAALAALAVFALAVPANAQITGRRTRRESSANRKARIDRLTEETYTKRWEVFGGGGFLRFRPGQYLQKNNEITWATSATYFLNPKFGIMGDIRGAFGNAKVGNNIYSVNNPLITEYTFLAGPTYRFYAKQKQAASVQAMGGYSLGNFDGGSKSIPAPLLGMWPTQNRPVFSVGVSYDYNFYPNLAFRVTPTYVGTTFGGTLENNIGVNAGIVYRFGNQTTR